MGTARSGVSLVEHRGYLYALGGFNGTTRLSTGTKRKNVVFLIQINKSIFSANIVCGLAHQTWTV